MFKKEKKQYAEDCKTHERPWELWQSALAIPGSLNWIDLYREPNWSEHCVYRRKQTTFMPEYYSGLNWRVAEHLIGKTVEGTNNPDSGWYVGTLRQVSKNEVIAHFGVLSDGHFDFVVYIRTCEETFKHPTINIGGVDLPMPETDQPEKGTPYYVFDPMAYYMQRHPQFLWKSLANENFILNKGGIHLTEERAKAWADWWKSIVIDKIKG